MMGYGGFNAAAGGYQATAVVQNQSLAQGNGGFMSPGFGSQNDSSQDDKRRGGSRNSSMRPVTIKQLLDAVVAIPDAPPKVDGHDLSQVVLVARVNSITIQSTNIDDGTGMIDAKKFISDSGFKSLNFLDGVETVQSEITEGSYARIFGQLRIFNQKRSLNMFKIMPVESVDEITHHFLEVIYTHLLLRAPPKVGLSTNLAQNDASYNQSAYAPPNQQNYYSGNGLSGLQSQIVQFFAQTQDTASGGSVMDLIHRIRGIATEDQVREQLDLLVNEGYLYTTIDDDHFKATGN